MYHTHLLILRFQISRIENYTLFNIYKSCKEEMERENGAGFQNERKLWHGTSADVLDNIYRGGFNRSYCGKNGCRHYIAPSFINAITIIHEAVTLPAVVKIKQISLKDYLRQILNVKRTNHT